MFRGSGWLLVAVVVWLGAPGGAEAQVRVVCESVDHQPNFCAADTSGGVQIRRQLSSARCREGDTWGYDRRGIWVDRGCRAEFDVRGWRSGRQQIITCSSENHQRQFCPADTRGGVRLLRRFSDAACNQGSSWGYDQRGIWVDRGCRAEFEVASGWRWGGSDPVMHTIRCESHDRRRATCPVQTRNTTIRLSRQLSDSPCRQGSTWGSDQRGIWVDRGCRAEFEVVTSGSGRRGREDRYARGRRSQEWTGGFQACALAVVSHHPGLSPADVDMEDVTQGGVGTQLIEWRIPSGATGYCRVNRDAKVVQFKQD